MSREIIKFPKRRGQRSGAEKWGVEKLPPRKVREDKLVLVLGSGRSGTMHTSRVLTKAGLDIRHEHVGKDGTASLFFNVDSDWHPMQPWTPGKVHVGERRSDFNFRHILHVVRHPRKVIPSMGAIFPALNYEFFEDNNIIPLGKEPQLLRCAHAYYGLNKLAEEQAEFRFQLEDFERSWPRIRKLLGLDGVPFPNIPHANKASGFRKRQPMVWSELHDMDPLLCRNIIKMAKKYGYED